jgi:UDP-GlcNAc:undecaprenyl-phosphate/decaprenyl-phosphate GlcNAc-1-phosphate transferase
MFLPLLTLVGSPIVALVAAIALMPLARIIGAKLGITASGSASEPGNRIVVFGGAAIVGAILLSLGLFDALPRWLGFSIVVLWLMGAIDDALELRPYQKLAVQIVVAAGVVFALPRFHFTPWFVVDLGIEIFWLVAASNAFNLIDGIDGLAAGTGIVAALSLAAAGVMHHNAALAFESLTVAGALAGFLIFNFPPASIFMGDSGALAVGMLLGAMALEGGALATNSRVTKYVFPILVMLMPLLDTAIVSVTRMATQNPISRRGDDHSHHRLMGLGLSDRTTDALCWGVAAGGAGLAIVAFMLPHAYLVTMLPLIAVAVAMIAVFMIDLTFETLPPAMVHSHVKGAARLILSFSYKRRVAEAVLDSTLITAAYFVAYLLRHNFRIEDWEVPGLIRSMPAVWLATYASFALTGIYRGIWRYTGLSDGIRFANGAVLAGIFLVALSTVMPVVLSGSILVLFVIVLFNLLVITRSSFQSIRGGLMRLAAGERVLVIGAGQAGSAALGYLFSERPRGFRVVGFLDDEAFARNDLVQGQRVLGKLADLAEVYRSSPFNRILIASETLAPASVEAIRDFAAPLAIVVHRFTIRMDDVGAIAAAEPLPPARATNGLSLTNPGTGHVR